MSAIVEAPAGVVTDMDEADYFTHPALSHSAAKRLLPPSCPALFKWERDHGRPDRKAFDLGHAAHCLVLGAGAPIAPIVAPDWRTNAAKQAREEARDAGMIPLLDADYQTVRAMAAELRKHPEASALLDPSRGTPEVSLFWTDDETGVELRCRLDWLPNPKNGRLVGVDYKSTVCAERSAFARAAATYGYSSQAPWYLDGIRANGLADDDAAFVYVVQEKTPPYLVNVIQLDDLFQHIGREQNRRAIDIYAECCATDIWPGYSTDVELVSPPGWLRHAYENGEI